MLKSRGTLLVIIDTLFDGGGVDCCSLSSEVLLELEVVVLRFILVLVIVSCLLLEVNNLRVFL